MADITLLEAAKYSKDDLERVVGAADQGRIGYTPAKRLLLCPFGRVVGAHRTPPGNRVVVDAVYGVKVSLAVDGQSRPAVVAVRHAERVGRGPLAGLAIESANTGEVPLLRRIQPDDVCLAVVGDDLVTGARSSPLAAARGDQCVAGFACHIVHFTVPL